MSLRLFSQYLGHQSPDMTEIYAHLTATNERQARNGTNPRRFRGRPPAS
jgi:integrase